MKIIGIHSYRGGTGKTTISLILSKILSENMKKKVLLIELNLENPMLYNIFGKNSLYINNYFGNNTSLFNTIKKSEQYFWPFDVIMMSPELDLTNPIKLNDEKWHLKFCNRLFNDLSVTDYDFIVLDNQSGRSLNVGVSCLITDYMFVVTHLDKISIDDTLRLLKTFYSTFSATTKFHIIINKVQNHPITKKLLDNWIFHIQQSMREEVEIYNISYDEKLAIDNEIKESKNSIIIAEISKITQQIFH